MVIDCIQYRLTNSKTFELLKSQAVSLMEFHLLIFWTRHPNAKLSLYSIASALDTAKYNLRDAISSLVLKNILIEQRSSNDLVTYSLNNNWSTQELISEMSNMDWNQLRTVEKQLEGAAVLH